MAHTNYIKINHLIKSVPIPPLSLVLNGSPQMLNAQKVDPSKYNQIKKNYAVKVPVYIFVCLKSGGDLSELQHLFPTKINGFSTYVLYVKIKCTYLFARNSSMAIRLVDVKLNVHCRSLRIPWSIFTISVLQCNAICEIP